jgi:hypothetical protein
MIQLLNSISQLKSDTPVGDELVDIVQGQAGEGSGAEAQSFLSLLFGQSEGEGAEGQENSKPILKDQAVIKNAGTAQDMEAEAKPAQRVSVPTQENQKLAQIDVQKNQIFQDKQNIKINSGEEFVQNKSIVQNMASVDGEDTDGELKELKNQQVKNTNKIVPNAYRNASSQHDSKMINANKVVSANDNTVQKNESVGPSRDLEHQVKTEISSSLGKSSDITMTDTTEGLSSRTDSLIRTSVELRPQVMTSEAKAPTTVLNMTDLEKTPTQNLIEKISNYFEQEQVQKAEKIDLVVKHDELGKFNVQVNKAARGSDIVDVKIQSMSQESHKFFKEHERELVQSMSKGGVKLGEFKLVGQSDTPSSQDRQSDRHGSSKNSDFNQQQNDEQKDSQRRRDMWKYYQDGLAA